MLKMCDLPSGCLPSLSTPDLVSSFPICPRESVEHTGLECYYCRLVQLWKIPRLSDFMESMSNYIGSVQPDGLEVLAIAERSARDAATIQISLFVKQNTLSWLSGGRNNGKVIIVDVVDREEDVLITKRFLHITGIYLIHQILCNGLRICVNSLI